MTLYARLYQEAIKTLSASDAEALAVNLSTMSRAEARALLALVEAEPQPLPTFEEWLARYSASRFPAK